MMEGVNSSKIYLIHCKNFCKCHSVPPPRTTKNNKNTKKQTNKQTTNQVPGQPGTESQNSKYKRILTGRVSCSDSPKPFSLTLPWRYPNWEKAAQKMFPNDKDSISKLENLNYLRTAKEVAHPCNA
jgi:hypothetical protein